MSNETEEISKTVGLPRRSYLKTAAGLLGVTALGSSGGAAESDFDVIEVPPGELHRVNLSDGETFENVLFDISARDSRVQIRARANDWTIRNIGVVGHWDSEESSFHPLVLEVPDPNSEGIVENVCFETTTESDAPYGNGPGGPYVYRGHAGHIRFERVYLQHFQDNGFYCSSPGRAEGGGGTVEIRDSYAYRCGVSNFRLGEGGELHNCVGVAGYRNFWVQFNEADAYGCDFLNDVGIGDVAAGSGQDRNAVAHMHDSRWETEGGSGTVSGSSAGTPEDRIPEGCPTTAERAAAGAGGDAEPPERETRFELSMTTDSELAEYLLELDADVVEPGDDANTHEHEFQDRAFEHDGLWYIHGYTAGGGDNFHVEDGEILRIGQPQGETLITINGDPLDLEAFDEIISVPGEDDGNGEDDDEEGDVEHELEVAGQFEYRIEVNGEIEPAEEHAQWLDEGEAYGEDWAEWWLSGGENARTVWKFTGDITTVDIEDRDGVTEIRTLTVDGDELGYEESDDSDEELDDSDAGEEDGRDDSEEESNGSESADEDDGSSSEEGLACSCRSQNDSVRNWIEGEE